VATSNENADIRAFSEVLRGLPPLRTALHHFGLCRMRADFNFDFFNAPRHHTMTDQVKIAGIEQPRLTLLLHTDKPLGALMPENNPVSEIDCVNILLRPLS
jgi:hypothetical protein